MVHLKHEHPNSPLNEFPKQRKKLFFLVMLRKNIIQEFNLIIN